MHTIASEETFSDGQLIFKEGSPGDWVYLILSGSVEITKNVEGRDVVIEVLKEGEVFGELGFLGGISRTAAARAVGETTLGMIERSFLDNEFNKLSNEFRSILVAVVPQIVEPVSMVVEEYVLLGRLSHYGRYQMFETSEDEAIARRYLELTGILHLKEAMMNELSGGERQLASIARALAQEPSLLLLDEPTAHLDIAHQVRILDLIKGLNRRLGLTVFVVLHDLNLAGEYCDKILLLREGLLVGKGTPEEVLTYKAVEETYSTVVLVEKSPLSGKPHVFLVTGDTMESALSGKTGEKENRGRKRE